MKWFSFLHRDERRDISSAEFEAAVNKVITADTVVDATHQPYITEEGALNLTAVWACVRILSETVGTLPLHLYRRTACGRERHSTTTYATDSCKPPTPIPHVST